MKAVVITSYGGVEGIGVQEVDTPPAPTADRVRVRVHAAGLNRADILQRRGHYPAPPGYPPNIPGMEFAGKVESIGDEVRTWKVGDQIQKVVSAKRRILHASSESVRDRRRPHTGGQGPKLSARTARAICNPD
jgi:NADPH:quinone reductase-like Zn-dependent oxidoreductase